MVKDNGKSAQDDHDWFEALSGKTDAGQGARLGRMLREVEQADAALEDTTHDWQRLQFALRRETARQGSKAGLRYFAIAASVLIVVGMVSMLMPAHDISPRTRSEETTVMRGKSEQVIFSANPKQEAIQLESELARLSVKVTRLASKDKVELDIQLSYPVSHDVRAVLETHIIPVPDQGDLNVTFLQATR
jgi:hypothetical protein